MPINENLIPQDSRESEMERESRLNFHMDVPYGLLARIYYVIHVWLLDFTFRGDTCKLNTLGFACMVVW